MASCPDVDEDNDKDGDEDDKDEDELLGPGILVIPVRVCNFSATISASKSHCSRLTASSTFLKQNRV